MYLLISVRRQRRQAGIPLKILGDDGLTSAFPDFFGLYLLLCNGCIFIFYSLPSDPPWEGRRAILREIAGKAWEKTTVEKVYNGIKNEQVRRQQRGLQREVLTCLREHGAIHYDVLQVIFGPHNTGDIGAAVCDLIKEGGQIELLGNKTARITAYGLERLAEMERERSAEGGPIGRTAEDEVA